MSLGDKLKNRRL